MLLLAIFRGIQPTCGMVGEKAGDFDDFVFHNAASFRGNLVLDKMMCFNTA